MERRYLVLQKLTEGQTLFVGSVAGAIEAAATQPLTYLKNTVQQRLRVSADPRIVYRGTLASCCADASLIGSQFVLCGSLQKLMVNHQTRTLSFFEEIICALGAGAASGLPCCALELTMIQQQRYGGSTMDTLRSLLAARGGGLFRGLGPSAAREAVFAAGYLGLSPQMDRLLPPTWATALSSLFSGLICAGITHPIDTIKSCMQGDVHRTKYGGFIHTYRTIYADGGPAAFYRGYGARAAMICICFYIFAETKLQLASLAFPRQLICDDPDP
ncbi:hypothetical protein CTAYLR_001733 [Chrysophaeum taylorii]|uniref:Mitochondrial carrier protein n=1 Tax=Chrysophaeum taylorii TaxID=2483200 RepID=A0AAD7UEP7_9STRA|nr:hypothetical protein CTAYLR_001733 [Chrysophaeum taylorii]